MLDKFLNLKPLSPIVGALIIIRIGLWGILC